MVRDYLQNVPIRKVWKGFFERWRCFFYWNATTEGRSVFTIFTIKPKNINPSSEVSVGSQANGSILHNLHYNDSFYTAKK